MEGATRRAVRTRANANALNPNGWNRVAGVSTFVVRGFSPAVGVFVFSRLKYPLVCDIYGDIYVYNASIYVYPAGMRACGRSVAASSPSAPRGGVCVASAVLFHRLYVVFNTVDIDVSLCRVDH